MAQPFLSGYQPSAGYGVGGIGSVFEYDDIVLNDRRFPDCLRVIEVTGLDDADIRDVRMALADTDGEVALLARYGGRTIGMTGVLDSGNYGRLLQMREDLGAAVSELTEKPFYIRATGIPGFLDRFWRNTFSWPSWTTAVNESGTVYRRQQGLYTFYSYTTNVFPFSTDGGRLLNPDANERVAVAGMGNEQYGDVEVRLRFDTGDSVLTLAMGTVAKLIDGSNFLEARVTGTALAIFKKDGGTFTSLATTAVAPAVNTIYWLRMRVHGNVVTAELWRREPSDWLGETSEVAARVTYTLATTNATKYGSGIRGRAGLRWTTPTNNEIVHELRILPWETRDTMLRARKVSSMQSRERQGDKHARREFMLTLRASNPRKLSAITNELLIDAVDLGGSAQYGRVFPLVWPKVYEQLLDGQGNPIALPDVVVFPLTNRGNFPAQPVVRIFGSISHPTLHNLGTGATLELTSGIDAGDWREIDTVTGVVTDSYGNNKFDELVGGGSEWIKIVRGNNYLKLVADSFDSNAKAKVFWRDTWM